MKLSLLLLSFLVFCVSGLVHPRARAPYHRPQSAVAIEDEYIVFLHPQYTYEAHFTTIGIDLQNVERSFIYFKALNGYFARLDSFTVQELIRYDPGVKSVEHNFIHGRVSFIDEDDQIYVASGAHSDVRRHADLKKRYSATQWNANHIEWDQVMVSKWNVPAPVPENKRFDMITNAGEGVYVYLLDTGIYLDHAGFQHRASNFKGYEMSPYYDGEPANDENGHGTHVAGIIRNTAPFADIVNVKAIRKDGHYETRVIAHALNDIILEHNEHKKNPPLNWRGSVINLSLGGSEANPAFQEAIKQAYEAGIPMATGSGNSGTPTTGFPCGYTDHVMCAGSCDRNYQYSNFSDYGSSVHIIAPGSHIWSTKNDPASSTESKSGTNMAAAHVAGIMAQIVSFERISSETAKVYSRLLSNTIMGVIKGIPNDINMQGTANRLVNTGYLNPAKAAWQPYLGAPFDLVNMAANYHPDSTSAPVAETSVLFDAWEQNHPDVTTSDFEGTAYFAPQSATSSIRQPISVSSPSLSSSSTQAPLPPSTSSQAPPPPSTSAQAPPPPSTTAPQPPPQPSLVCTGIDNVNWVGLTVMSNAITKFCSEAAKQGVQDTNTGSISRRYNPGTGEEVGLNMDWAPGLPFTLVESECVAHMSLVMNSCDGNDPKNPMNWKHGGTLQVGPVRYVINVVAKRYFAGTCNFKLTEYENGQSPTAPPKYTFNLKLEARDAKDNDVGGTGGEQVSAGDQNPYRLEGVYHDALVITPEAKYREYDYVQFTIGDQSWRQDNNGVTPGCSSGEYEETGDRAWRREMVCTFRC